MKKKVLVPAGVLLILMAALLAFLAVRSRSRSFRALRGDKDFNVVLITLDTLRADRLGCYGYPRIETPTIDGFARRGLKFENCISQTPLTLPSHTSLLTGTQPFFHGVRDNGGFVVPEKLTTLAEVFKASGYATSAFVAAYVLDSKWGLNQGFDTYFDRFDLSKFEKISLGSVQRPANEVMDEALSWLEKNKDKKFFSWIHLYDPHTPYEPPPPFAERYPKNPYVGEIAFADSQLARLDAFLRDAGLTDRTFLVFAGDHGESLGEHRESTHGFFIYQEAVHVPLIFVTPFAKLQGVSVSPVVSLVDVMPTVLEMAGLASPPEVQGESLAPLFFHPAASSPRYAYSETFYPRFHYGWSELRSFQDGRHKLILAPEQELYNLEADGEELRNIAADEDRTRGDLERKAGAFIERLSRNALEVDYRKIDEETREKLAALGYIGSFTDSSKLKGRVLANPKEKIVVFNELCRAREMGMSGQAEEAIRTIQAIIAADPEINDAYFSVGNILFKERRFAEAIPYFEQSLQRKPDDAFCVINIANSYLNMGKPEEGERFVIEHLKKGFSDSQLYFILGTLCFHQKKYDEAIKHYEECLSFNSESAASHNAIAAIHLNREELTEAESHLRAARAISPRLVNLEYNIAELREKQGNLEEAAAAYKRELENSPFHFRASYNLSRVCRLLGRIEEEEIYLKKTIDLNPDFPLSYFYLARIYLNRGENYREAVDLAKKGIELGPEAQELPLGYFLLADLYGRLGESGLAAANAAKGRELERSATRRH